MHRCLLPVLAGVILTLPIPALAQGAKPNPNEHYRVRVQYGRFASHLEGTAAQGVDGVAGTEFDVKQDLAMEDNKVWFVYGTIRLGAKWKLRGGYTSLEYNGETVLDKRISYAGTTFRIGEDVASSINGGLGAADLEWDFVNTGSAYLGVMAGARVPYVDTVMVSPDLGKRVQGSYKPVSPVIGLGGRAYAGRVSLEGFATSFVRISGNRITDLEITTRVHFSSHLNISGGYRYISYSAQNNPDFGDFKVTGWTYGLEFGL